MSQDKLSYEFAETGGGSEGGLNNPLDYTFKNAASLARESLQNVIDARDNESEPVRAEFKLTKISATELPQHDGFLEIFKACRDSRRNYYKDNVAADFFQDAISILESNVPIKVLSIRDYNTKGLTGEEDDPTGNQYNLLKSLGSSYKSSASGGSYGFGKAVYSNASYFRTFFVSSVTGEGKRVFQGKLKLVAHVREDKKFQDNGSFGLLGQRSVTKEEYIPSIFRRDERFRRDEQGTDFHIIGFNQENWEEQMISSVLNNFWLAVLKGTLVVKIGEQNITKDNIGDLIHNYFSKSKLDKNNPLPHFLAYTEKENREIVEKNIPILGDVSLYVRQDKEIYPYRKTSYFRNTGMEINRRDSRPPYGFAGVFVCNSKEGNEILRMMETPQHDKWDPSYAKGKIPEGEAKARGAIKELDRFVRESLNAIASSGESESLGMPGIGDLFPGEENGTADYETPWEVGAVSETSGIEIIRRVKIHNRTKKHVPGPVKKIISLKTRSFAVEDKNGKIEHIVNIRGKPKAKFNLTVEAGTDDSSSQEDINIIEAKYVNGSDLNLVENTIRDLKLDEHGETRITVSFETNDRYALKFTAME